MRGRWRVMGDWDCGFVRVWRRDLVRRGMLLLALGGGIDGALSIVDAKTWNGGRGFGAS